jgi:hypothetical protein
MKTSNKTCKQCDRVKDKDEFSGRSLTCKYCTNQNSIKKKEEKAILEGTIYIHKPRIEYDANKTHKTCTKCSEEKELSEYYINRKSKDGYTARCIKCQCRKRIVSDEDLISKICNTCNIRKEMSEFSKDKGCRLGFKNKCKICYKICKNSYMREYIKNRLENDVLFRISKNIRTNIVNSFRKSGYKKNYKAYYILGCSFEEFKLHLESKFEDWMTWENYGKYNGELNYGWDLDHIIPISSAINEESVVKLNHFTNFQPLCSYINRYIKSNKLVY